MNTGPVFKSVLIINILLVTRALSTVNSEWNNLKNIRNKVAFEFIGQQTKPKNRKRLKI